MARQSRDPLLGIVAFCLSLASVLWLMWSMLMNGTLGNPAADPFPDALQRATVISLLISVIGAFFIGPFWRSSSGCLGVVAAAPYWLTAALFTPGGRVLGLFWWLGSGGAAFLVFDGITRLCRFLRPSKAA